MKNRFPFCDLKADYAFHKAAVDAQIQETLDSGWFILGEKVARFEQAFADWCGAAHGIGAGSGTDAIVLALRAAGIGAGDAVITVSHTAVATVAAIEWVGAIPILVDIEPGHFTICPNSVQQALKTFAGHAPIRAIIPVHMYGHSADMDAIMTLAQEHNLIVIEDCSQAHGATWKGKTVGTFGHMAAFSLYPTKNLGAYGDAGIVVTDDQGLAQTLRQIRQYGWRARYDSERKGGNSRLDEMQAAVLCAKLPFLSEMNARRRRNAKKYREEIFHPELRLPLERPYCENVYHQFTLRWTQRDALQAHLASNGVPTARLYPKAVHQQCAYRNTWRVELKETETLVKEMLSLPIHPFLTQEQLKTVIHCVSSFALVS